MTAFLKYLVPAIFVSAALIGGCNKDKVTGPAPSSTPPTPSARAGSNRLEIVVTENGFEPDHLPVEKGKPTTLAFTRKTDKTCAKEVILQVGDGTKVERALPLNETVEIAATFPKAGEVQFACGMDMVKGHIVVQ
ncbi:MAG: cupredoxin domain-containing protein [Kofleriaceae bacterium]